MKSLGYVALLLAISGTASAANAALQIDGVRAGYGAVKSRVAFDALAPTSNFGAPTGANHLTAYDIYLTTDADYVYGYVEAIGGSGVPGVVGANLYFDLDQATAPSGSDLGFEITNDRAFVPGVGGYDSFGTPTAGALPGLDYVIRGDSRAIEFRIANALFTGPIAGLTQATLAAPGATIRLNLSQSFGYSVAGGAATYGNTRLGTATLGVNAVPEPAAWAMMALGFGLVGGAVRRRRGTLAAA